MKYSIIIIGIVASILIAGFIFSGCTQYVVGIRHGDKLYASKTIYNLDDQSRKIVKSGHFYKCKVNYVSVIPELQNCK